MKRKLLFPVVFLFASIVSTTSLFAQVTTNGGSGLAATYASLEAAITALNSATISSPVVINLTASNPQTAPVGGYEIKAEGNVINTITINGNNNTITANGALTAGSLTDGIFKIIGGDYITINGFSLTENAANTTKTEATNNMTEWGIALLYITATNGAQNNTITNCTIDLDRTYQNSFGIYSNSNHSATIIAAGFPATSTNGLNSGLTITSCTVTDVNIGIVAMGASTVGADHDGLTIGGSVANGNTISNFGNTGSFSAFANVLASSTGIFMRYIKNINVSYNNISTSSTGPTAGTLRGINLYATSAATAPTGTIVNSITNNTFSLTSSATTATEEIRGIQVDGLTANNTTTLNISNNNFTKISHVGGAGPESCIYNTGLALTTNINNNTFTNLISTTTGNFYFIYSSVTMPVGASQTCNNNSIVGSFSKTGAGGVVAAFYSGASSPTGTTVTQTGNNFSNITITGATTLELWRNRDGASTASGPIKTISNNTFNNIVTGTNQATGMILNASGVGSIISNNTISNISGGGIIIGANMLGNENGTFQNNVIFGLSSTGANAVSGIVLSGTGTSNAPNVYKNKIYNIQTTNAGGSVNGILVSFIGTGVVSNIVNNIIGDLKAPSGNSDVTDIVRGISITSTSTAANFNVYYNTVYLNATSTGTSFGTSGIYHAQSATASTAALDLRNNIIINTSTASGLGFTVAYKRSATGYDNYLSSSNNNIFYAGTPSATNLIFTNGTDNFQALADFKTAVAARETASKTENVSFASLTSSSSSYLHINTAVPTFAESGGVAISGYADDFDGDARNASTPDIGADEFAGTIVPISLQYFTGVKDGDVNKINWVTISEINNKGFDVERSADGKKFSSIGFIKSKSENGNSSNSLAYEFNDKLNTNSSFYYRLKQTDYDGKISYSKVIFLKERNIDKLEIVSLYPNPAIASATLRINASIKSKANVCIYDMNGRKVITEKTTLLIGENNIQLNTGNLAKGNYIVKVESNNEFVQTKLIKQ